MLFNRICGFQRVRIGILTLQIVCMTASKYAFAVDSDQVRDVSNLNVEQIAKLPESVVAKLPVFETLAKVFAAESLKDKNKMPLTFETARRLNVMLAELSLSDLKFLHRVPNGTTDQELTSAIQSFQRSIGVPANGILSVEQFQKLQDNASKAKYIDVTPMGGNAMTKGPLITTGPGFAIASGTWVYVDDQIADPINNSKISCDKAKRSCQETSARILQFSTSRSLEVDAESYDVLSWGDKEVVAETKAMCRTTTLTINFSTNEVFAIHRNGGFSGNCSEGPMYHNLKKPQISKLIYGFEATQNDASLRRRREEAEKVLNPEYNKIIRYIRSQFEK